MEETKAAENAEALQEENTDLDDLPVREEEKPFFDNTEFQDYDDDEDYHGGFVSVAAFVLSLASIAIVVSGLFWLVIAASAVALILGIIAVVRKHAELGFAVGGILISFFVIVLCSWAYIDYPYFWSKNGEKGEKKFSIHDYDDTEPGVLASFSVQGMVFVSDGGVD